MKWKEKPCSSDGLRMEAKDQVGTFHTIVYHYGLKSICLVIENQKKIISFDPITSEKVFGMYVDFPVELKIKLVDFEKLLKMKRVVDCL